MHNKPAFKTLAIVATMLTAPAALAQSTGANSPVTAFTDCDGCPTMQVIAAGRFTMGSTQTTSVIGEDRPEGPVHEVTIRRPFAIGITEVTNAQFGEFVADAGYTPSADCSKWKGSVLKFGGSWRDPDYGRAPLPQEPVVCVSWHDAKAYVVWLAEHTSRPYRLLSEAEWEYAARAGSNSTWPWGAADSDVCSYANIFDAEGSTSPYAKEYGSWDPVECNDGAARVATVGSLKPNSWGLYDMIGNVWEWTEDCSFWLYHPDAINEQPQQAEGACDKRAVRGGSWFTRLERQRPTFRGRDPEALASHIFGFRVARDIINTQDQ